MSGPIAPERNPPIHPEYYEPRVYTIEDLVINGQGSLFGITGATRANPCVLTTDIGCNVGETVKIQNVVGMTELNGNAYEVVDSDSTSVSIDVDSSAFTPYVSGGDVFRFESSSVYGEVTVVTVEPNDYVVGQLTRLLIPTSYGASKLNRQQGYVSSIPYDNEVVLSLDTQYCNSFVNDPLFGPTEPQILAIGDGNQGYVNPNGRSSSPTSIPGAFINISPL